ncbi:MAG: hypothetical protein A2X22_07365 [Bacteroidetes bacterium GWF2_49_14]|nr:MAG: hypothetical protein A2X22_07365 [Bacteroidetes bacterium GWF2_49_14]
MVSCENPVQDHYTSSKPLTRWWWFASEIKKADVADQLEWLKANGFGGVEVAWVYPLNRMQRDTVNTTPKQLWLSEEWGDVVRYCKEYADSLGLSVDFTFGSLWPFGDLLVKPEESSKEFGHPEFRQWISGSWEYPKKGLVLDHLNKEAFLNYAGRTGKALEPAMKTGRPSGIFVDSWEVETHNLWTTGFDSIFMARYGYDITTCMQSDILSADYAGQRYDYMKLISDLIIKNFYMPFTEKAHELGGFSRGQCSGSPTDIISSYASLDVPESEAMLYEPYFTRIVASAAALAGKNIVSAETFTCLYGWPREHMREEKVTDLKIVADALFAHGLNQIVWHGMPFNTKGSDTISFYATVHVGKAGALSKEIPAFNQYLETLSGYMRKGKSYSDVAIYLPAEDAWIAGEMPKEKQLPWAWGEYEFRYLEVPEEIRGWQPVWINGEFLKDGRQMTEDGRKTTEDGRKSTTVVGHRSSVLTVGNCKFSALYVDSKYLDYEVLRTMVSLAEGGMKVCLKQVPEEAGYVKHPEFGSLVKRLKELSSPDWHRVVPGRPLVEGADMPWFWARQDGKEMYIFFAHPVAKEFKYPVRYGQADTAETLTKKISINFSGKTIPVDLVFKPYQSLLVNVSRSGTVRFLDLPWN